MPNLARAKRLGVISVLSISDDKFSRIMTGLEGEYVGMFFLLHVGPLKASMAPAMPITAKYCTNLRWRELPFMSRKSNNFLSHTASHADVFLRPAKKYLPIAKSKIKDTNHHGRRKWKSARKLMRIFSFAKSTV